MPVNIQKNILQKLFLILLVIFVSGCSFNVHITKSKYMDEQEKKKSILVFGYFDDSEAPFNMAWGDIKQVRPITDEAYKELRSNGEGLFYLENLSIGLYKLISLAGSRKSILSSQPWSTKFPEPSSDPDYKRLELRTIKSGVYFLGSYKLKLVKKGGSFGSDKFEMTVLKKPTEKQVLRKLLKYAKGTKWKKMIQQRIKRLRK